MTTDPEAQWVVRTVPQLPPHHTTAIIAIEAGLAECVGCIYYTGSDGNERGECRVQSPANDGWPIVQGWDWCGEGVFSIAALSEAESRAE